MLRYGRESLIVDVIIGKYGKKMSISIMDKDWCPGRAAGSVYTST